MISEAQQKLIDDIMDWFDFEQCSKMMLATNFGWYATDHPQGNIPELRRWCRNYLRELYEGKLSMSGCGGFEFTKGEYEDGQEWLKMAFIPEVMEVEVELNES